MGLFSTLRNIYFGKHHLAPTVGRPAKKRRTARRCQIESLEPRRLMAADVVPQVVLASVYLEDASQDDAGPDTIEVSFVGGAAGTTLDRLVINGDKQNNGMAAGDIIFDIASGGFGAYGNSPFSIVSADGFSVTGVSVVDGGSQIVFTFSGFQAGMKFRFSIDVDEIQFIENGAIVDGQVVDPGGIDIDAEVTGFEFQRTIMVGDFSAPGYVDLTLTERYWDFYDSRFATAKSATGILPNVPPDRYFPNQDLSVWTAGAVAHAPQIPLATISGWVYHDRSDDGSFNRDSEEGIGGVTLELLDANGNPTGITTITSSAPGKVGYYEFRDLWEGTYGIREVQPSGWLDGKDTLGSLGGVLAASDLFTQIFVQFGDDGIEYNFGELLPGSISGRVGASLSPDCNFDNPDISLEGVRIDLLDAQGNFIIYTTTNSQGYYYFLDLHPGEYQVVEHQPEGYYQGGNRIGSAGGTKVVQDHIGGIYIGSDVHAVNYDFCEHVGANISGYVYHDRDDNGVYDRDNEEPITGVTVRLYNAQGLLIHTTTTNSQGYYEFTNLDQGTYTIMEVQPSGWLDGKDSVGSLGGIIEVSDRITQIVLAYGDSGVEYNFGELLPGSISGRVHAHSGWDCHFDDPEILLEGVRIDLLDAAGNVLATTLTNAQGEYIFTGLRPGTYGIREHQPEGYFDGGERIGTAGGTKYDVPGLFSIFAGINLVSGFDAVRYDFCEQLPASISGRVHAHTGPNCEFDNPEFLLANVRIDLLSATGTLVSTTYTDARGEYKFAGLAPGEYQVFEHQPEGYYDGGERVGSAGGQRDGIDTIYGIVLPPGMNGINYDFCEHIGVNISGNVYHDRSNDGVFDRDTEEGIAGVVLKLLDANGNDSGLRATTNAQGFYQFTNLAAGVYSIMEIHPAGWLDGIDTPGNLGGVADTSIGGDMISHIEINWGQTGIEYNFGELLPGSISGRVGANAGPDCKFDNPDYPLAGVRIDLLDVSGKVVATTYTDAQGDYSFTGLRPGTYGVREHQPMAYFDGGERVGTAGGVSYDELGYSFITGINIVSAFNAIHYDFCEKLPGTISGYVFIDGPPIATNEPLTDQQIAELRDGQRTRDDTPLANVVLELRDGVSGEPIFVGQALAGHYAGSNETPIRVVTNSLGYYQFTGLAAGTYAVIQISPEGLIDGVDTPGTLGGFAVNAVTPASQSSNIPTPAQKATIEMFREHFGNDAIVRIPLQAGQHARENNFSEVQTVPVPPPQFPPERPAPLPPPVFGAPGAPFVPPLVLAPVPPVIPPPEIYGGSSQAIGFTWHLSVVNAGWPRSTLSTAARFQLASTQFEVLGWTNQAMNQGQWTLASLEGDRVVVLGEYVFGRSNGTPIVGDWNGDGVTNLGVFVDGQWFLDLNGNGVWDEGDLWAQLGGEDDIPVVGDWDADGKTDIGIFGPAWPRDPWAIEREPGLPDVDNFPTRLAGKMKNMPPTPEEATDGARLLKRTVRGKSRADLIDHVFHYGAPNDIPVTGDWNGDGIRQIGVFRDGQWWLDTDGDGRFTEADQVVQFGQSGDLPVVGDFNGDGVDQIGIYRDGRWILDMNRNYEIDAADKVFELGGAGDIPVVGDWNDDGIDDPGIYQSGSASDRVARRAG